MKINNLDDKQRGYLAECLVITELAKRGIYASNLTQSFDFDIITALGTRIEVKSSVASIRYPGRDYKTKEFIHPHKSFAFMNNYMTNHWTGIKGTYKRKSHKRDRFCDFFVCVCFNKDLTVMKTYIFPKEIVGDRQSIMIPYKKAKKKVREGCIETERYLEKWDLLTDFRTKKCRIENK